MLFSNHSKLMNSKNLLINSMKNCVWNFPSFSILAEKHTKQINVNDDMQIYFLVYVYFLKTKKSQERLSICGLQCENSNGIIQTQREQPEWEDTD